MDSLFCIFFQTVFQVFAAWESQERVITAERKLRETEQLEVHLRVSLKHTPRCTSKKLRHVKVLILV